MITSQNKITKSFNSSGDGSTGSFVALSYHPFLLCIDMICRLYQALDAGATATVE